MWGIADDCLRDVYVRGKYRDVILPIIVIRRLAAVLVPTKDAVLQIKSLDEVGVINQTDALCRCEQQKDINLIKLIEKADDKRIECEFKYIL